MSNFIYMVLSQEMLNEVISEMKRMNRGQDTDNGESSAAASGSETSGRKVSFSRKISVNEYMGESSLLEDSFRKPNGKNNSLLDLFQ